MAKIRSVEALIRAFNQFQKTKKGARAKEDKNLQGYDFSTPVVTSAIEDVLNTKAKTGNGTNYDVLKAEMGFDRAEVRAMVRRLQTEIKLTLRPETYNPRNPKKFFIFYQDKYTVVTNFNFNTFQKRITVVKNRIIKTYISNDSDRINKLLAFVFVGVNIFSAGVKKNKEAKGSIDGKVKSISASIRGNQASIGFQIGHLSGPGVKSGIGLIKKFRGALEDVAQTPGIDISKVNELDLELEKYLTSISEIDANVILEQKLQENSTVAKRAFKTTKTITFSAAESAPGNTLSGSALGRFLKDLEEFIEKELDQLHTITGSPSYEDSIIEVIIAQFLERKPKLKKKYRTVKKFTSTTKVKVPVYSIKAPKVQAAAPQSQGIGLDVQSLIALINKRLPDTVKANMGKGNAPQSLNYRTGRFSSSAELKGLTSSQTGKSLVADITYQRNPYDVFLPGGRLHKPLRNPEKLIGKSIRQILKEEGLAGLPMRTRLVR